MIIAGGPHTPDGVQSMGALSSHSQFKRQPITGREWSNKLSSVRSIIYYPSDRRPVSSTHPTLSWGRSQKYFRYEINISSMNLLPRMNK